VSASQNSAASVTRLVSFKPKSIVESKLSHNPDPKLIPEAQRIWLLCRGKIHFYSHSNTPQLAAGMETSPVTVVK